MSKVKIAIAGVGNCANSLLQGATYYEDAELDMPEFLKRASP